MPDDGAGVVAGLRDFTEEFCTASLVGNLLLQRCGRCGRYNPLSVTQLCHHCGSTDLIATRSSGRCTVLSRTEVARPADSGHPRTVVLVELEEGVRLLGIARGVDAGFDEELSFVQRDPSSGALVFGPRREPEAVA